MKYRRGYAMKMVHSLFFLGLFVSFCVMFACLFPVAGGEAVCEAGDPALRLGVLANRGAAEAFRKWHPLADYLASGLARPVEVVPLDFSQLRQTVAAEDLDLVIANPLNFIEFQDLYGVVALATMEKKGLPLMGGVIFTRKDSPITSLGQLAEKRIAAVSRDSLGGFLMQTYTLKRAGVDVFARTTPAFLKNQDHVVFAVLNGAADAGFVRTDQLEGMAKRGAISMGDFRVVNALTHKNFPYACSTELFPEWPACATRRLSKAMQQRVAQVLFSLPEDAPAAKAAGITGFVPAGDYTTVSEAMKAVGPR